MFIFVDNVNNPIYQYFSENGTSTFGDYLKIQRLYVYFGDSYVVHSEGSNTGNHRLKATRDTANAS